MTAADTIPAVPDEETPKLTLVERLALMCSCDILTRMGNPRMCMICEGPVGLEWAQELLDDYRERKAKKAAEADGG